MDVRQDNIENKIIATIGHGNALPPDLSTRKQSTALAIITDSQFLVPFFVMVIGILMLTVLH
ncbi:hypothetical protein [Paraburkholderia lacunae]|uniref:Uncharacterized protein n=1 Tax=Paraburkholderia lacunae TaxID=2211104 RepID=A0A370N0E4_9BURK|nr:hypothetical protein [Paraburkholderia lacunae]RDJ99089.1 hypothetical protein DLM46_30355 [Paraburkholderia lacunae]